MGHIPIFIEGEEFEYLLKSYSQDEVEDDDMARYDYGQVGGRYARMFNGLPFTLVGDMDIDRVECPYAYITRDGEFHSPEYYELTPDWDEQVRGWLRTLSNAQIITVADVHV